MRRSGHQNTPAIRKARVAAVVDQAKADGEKVPKGVAMLPCRNLTAAERAYGKTLEPQSARIRAAQKRHKEAA